MRKLTQQIKNLALSLLWHRFDLQAMGAAKKKKKRERERERERNAMSKAPTLGFQGKYFFPFFESPHSI